MNTNKYWKLLEDLPFKHHDCIAEMESRLSKVEPSELLDFDRLIWSYAKEAYHWKLWRVAYIILGGCSDSSFHNFRLDLISLGRNVYEQAIDNPNTLASYPTEAFCGRSNLDAVAEKVYHDLTGGWIDEIPGLNREIQLGDNLIKIPVEYDEPKGERGNFDDYSESEALFPDVWKKWGGEYYSEPFKDSVVKFVIEYNKEHGSGGAAAAKKQFDVNPISIATWLKQAESKKTS